MSSMTPPPFAPAPQPMGEFGGNPSPMPAPAAPPQPGAIQDSADILEIISRLRGLADRHPQAVPVIGQMNNLVQQLQMTLQSAGPPTEPAAPPV